ncbi:MAG: hypothetical protein KGL36_05020 [Gammaproteobacteria bacterium]|nr:hypothetical protein [Gammaproteobacteria bacterium]
MLTVTGKSTHDWKTKSPDERAYRRSARALCEMIVAFYCGELAALAEEAAAVASEAAALAAVASLAGAEAASVVAGAEAVVLSVDGAGASVFLPQALNTKAAAIALTTSLVFIYRYPKMF